MFKTLLFKNDCALPVFVYLPQVSDTQKTMMRKKTMENATAQTITLEARTDNSRLESLLANLIEMQDKTNRLLQEIATHPTGKKETLTHTEAAAFLGLSPKTLYDMVSEKRVPFKKAGSKNLFYRSDLESWLENRSAKAGAIR